ncbi:MAG: DUF3488 and transglutaminase-like domain-containing protein [Acidobacteriia bacterium]|nr:DUF3488 and transglutaminase-like domain-containing protein [Terriglobia bacterium]
MSFAGCYKLSIYLLVASGFLAAAATGALNPIVLALLGSVLLAGWFIDTARLRRALPAWAWRGVLLAGLPAWYLDLILLSHSLLLSTLHLMLFAAAVKLLTRQEDRDNVYLYLLSFGVLLTAAVLTSHAVFLLCLFLFLCAALSSLTLFEMKRSSARAREGGVIQPVVIPRSLRGTGFELFAGFPSKAMGALTLLFSVSIAILAVPLFFLLPRVSLGVHHYPAGRPAIISGFSETVELGDIGRIQESNELVMKVQVDAPLAQQPPDLKWRGIALDHFDGRSWSRSRSDRNRIPTQAGYYKLEQTTQGTNVLVQTFLLEPISTDIVFGSHKVLAVSPDLGWLERDGSDNIYSLTQRKSAIRYSVVSDITRPDPALIAPHSGRPPREVEACCLQLPQEDPRVAELAQRVTAEAVTGFAKARALESYLRTAYGYSLELKGTPNSADPLAMFLFDVRRGHCEYFATAMAVMLRQLGIPSRLVNGFRAGEYNSLSDHWTVRQYNAHSWVEAWFPPYGWIEFDPTPAGSEPQTPAFWKTITRFGDSCDLWWSEHVVSYDLRKQSRLIRAGGGMLQAFQLSAREYAGAAGRSFVAQLSSLHSPQRAVILPVILAIFTVALLLTVAFLSRRPRLLMRRLRRVVGRTRIRRDQRAEVISFYGEAIDVLQSHGWQRRNSQTPLEFSRNLAGEPFGAALASLTALYNRVRFGKVTQEADAANARELLRLLRTPQKENRRA